MSQLLTVEEARSKTQARLTQLTRIEVSGLRFRHMMMARSKTLTKLVSWQKSILVVMPNMERKILVSWPSTVIVFDLTVVARSKTMTKQTQLKRQQSAFST